MCSFVHAVHASMSLCIREFAKGKGMFGICWVVFKPSGTNNYNGFVPFFFSLLVLFFMVLSVGV